MSMAPSSKGAGASASSDPGILCFQHCLKTAKVFCLELPDYCPTCESSMTSIELKIPPFQVPYPFVSAKRAPCSVVIRPTEGDFLHFYQNAADLHIGVTDSNGEVFEFDKNGVHAGTKSHSWQQSLVIPIVAEQSSSWREYWDYTLHIASEMENWTSDKYAQDGNNCYSFVLAFLKMLQVKDLKPSLTSKTQFCKDFLVPRTKNAAKYIALYRQVIKEGVAVISVH